MAKSRERRFFGAVRRDTGVIRDIKSAEGMEMAELLLMHNYTAALKALCDVKALVVTIAEEDPCAERRSLYGTVLREGDFIRDVAFCEDPEDAESLLMHVYSPAMKELYQVKRLNVRIDPDYSEQA